MEKNPTWTCVVALALYDGEGRWLMHRRPPGKHHGGLWEFPGGKVENGEKPRFALVREIREELGIAVSEGQLAAAGFADERDHPERAPIVILLYTSPWTGEQVEALEGGEVGWFEPAAVACLERPPLDIELCRQLFEKDAL